MKPPEAPVFDEPAAGALSWYFAYWPSLARRSQSSVTKPNEPGFI